MGRPSKPGEALLIYLDVIDVTRRCRQRFRLPNGRPVPLLWCREVVQKRYAKHRDIHLSDGAIRAACKQGKKIAEKIAVVMGLPESLTDEERARKLMWRLSTKTHAAEMAEREARDREERARDHAYHAAILKRVGEILTQFPRKKRPAKKP